MCRIAGYLGAPTSIATVVSETPHSLRKQAREPRELPPGMLGSDGYGIAWHSGLRDAPARYRQTLPIWTDPNLDTLAPHLEAACFVASTRTADRAMPVSLTNTPPFCFGSVMFVHNGSIPDFHAKLIEPLREPLRVETRRAILGNTDSEYLAGCLADAAGATLAQRVGSMLRTVSEVVKRAGSREAQLNLIAAEANELVAVRYAIGTHAPSLYVATRARRAVVVASEALCEDEPWTRVSEGSLLRVVRANDEVTVTCTAI